MYKAISNNFKIKDGGGTIDAAELQKTLEECDIYVDGNDLVEILMTIDHDGNGEVDFEEFLSLMTNTNIFIQAVDGTTDAKNDQYRKRVILFDALTQFLRKQALKAIGLDNFEQNNVRS